MPDILLCFSDMINASSDLKTAILARLENGESRGIWTPQDFLDLGTRDAVDKTLQRLTRASSLRRAGRALYDNRPDYDFATAMPPTFSIRLEGKMLDELRRDYRAMSEMIFGEAPSFEAVVEETSLNLR